MSQRVLKFRAWETGQKRMFYDGSSVVHFSLQDSLDGGILSSSDLIKIMQFTGLLDKNGKEIYEGDIVSCEIYHLEGVVEFGEIKRPYFSTPGFGIRRNGELENMIYKPKESEPQSFIEVIGNIHENPELLIHGK